MSEFRFTPGPPSHKYGFANPDAPKKSGLRHQLNESFHFIFDIGYSKYKTTKNKCELFTPYSVRKISI